MVTWPDADPAAPAPERYALYGDRLENVALTAFRAQGSSAGVKPLVFENSKNVTP